MNRDICFLQATTAPYRTEMFNLMEEESKKSNINISVAYYKDMMKGRNWKVNKDDFKHNYKIYNCYEVFFKSYPFYFSYSLLKNIIKKPNMEIVLGVSWNDFLIVTIIMLKKLGIVKNKLHFWTEANYMAGSMKKENKLKNLLRNFIFNTLDGKLIIPGKIAEITIKKYWKLNNPYIFLPNTVDVDYSDIENQILDQSKINILIIARLEEERKGILNFLKNIDKEDFKKCNFFIAGDGPDKNKYEEFIKRNNYNNINLMGNIDRNILLSYYKSCDVFVLPSFSDPNPLSVIEALFASKPMLLSNQCGNNYEAIDENSNGYVFNPYDTNDIKKKFNIMIENRKDFNSMGKKSFEIANSKFHPRKIVSSFLEEI